MFTVTIPVANTQSANAALQAAGHGPGNFSLPIWTGGAMPAIASLDHLPNDPAFRAACAALPGATVRDINMGATTAAVAGRWGGNAPLLQGNVAPGLYRAVPADGGLLWWVLQAFDRNVFNLALSTYPALCQRARVPGVAAPWTQPSAENGYKLVEPFTQQPERVIHNGQIWRVSQGDASGANFWEPGVFGWTSEGPAP